MTSMRTEERLAKSVICADCESRTDYHKIRLTSTGGGRACYRCYCPHKRKILNARSPRYCYMFEQRKLNKDEQLANEFEKYLPTYLKTTKYASSTQSVIMAFYRHCLMDEITVSELISLDTEDIIDRVWMNTFHSQSGCRMMINLIKQGLAEWQK